MWVLSLSEYFIILYSAFFLVSHAIKKNSCMMRGNEVKDIGIVM